MVLANARVIDGTGRAPFERASVRIEDCRIAIAPGAFADLLVFDGDPLADIRVLRDPARIWMVVHAGRIVAGDTRVPLPTPA